MILVTEYVNFLIDHDLTQEQLLFLELVYKKEVGLIKMYKEHFPNGSEGMISPYLLEKLVEKEFLIRTKTGFKLGNKFLDIYVTPDKAVDEIFDLYPTFITSKDGVQIPLITMDKKVFREIYIPKIMGNLNEHREVLKDIEYGIKHNLLSLGINKFVTSEYWKGLRKERINNINVEIKEDKFDEDF